MAVTPEGAVKKKVTALLNEAGCYHHMPVPGGFGGTTLDYIGCHYGFFFGIETKAPGKKPTERQEVIIKMIQRARGETFVIDQAPGPEFDRLKRWLKDMEAAFERS